MCEANATLRSLGEIADTNPETLATNTPRSARFRYIDLSAVETGFIKWDAVVETTYGAAPSRARRMVRPLDVLFGTVRPNLQSHGFIGESEPGPLVASTGFSVIRARDGVSHPAYLFHSMMSCQVAAQAVRDGVGSSYPAVNDSDVKKFEIFFPSFRHQEQIAQVLDTLDTAIHETEAIIAKLKAVKQGLLHDLLTRGIDANGELRRPQAEAPHLYKKSPLGWIPNEWEIKTITEIADVKSGSTPSREQANRYFAANGTPWVKTLDLNEDVICETDECITATALRETSCSLLPQGTVLVAMYGGWEQIGRTALLAVSAATNQAISALVFRSARTVPEFVLRALQHGRPRWQRVAASTRKDPNITKTDVLAFEVPLPAPNEQSEIAGRVQASLDRLEFEADMLAKLRHQKSGLMDDLLTGHVRVTSLLAEAEQKGSV